MADVAGVSTCGIGGKVSWRVSGTETAGVTSEPGKGGKVEKSGIGGIGGIGGKVDVSSD